MAFKRVIIRRVGPLSWFLEDKEMSLFSKLSTFFAGTAAADLKDLPITRETIDALLKNIEIGYMQKDINLLRKTISMEGSFIKIRHYGDSFRRSKQNGYAFFNEIINVFNGGLNFTHYVMRLSEIVEESDTKWIIKCQAEFRANAADMVEAHICSEETLVIQHHEGYPVVTDAEIHTV